MSSSLKSTMRKIITSILFIAMVIYGSVYLGYEILKSPDTGVAVLAGVVAALICAWIVALDKTNMRFLFRVFIAALIVRWVVALFISSRGLQGYLGGDASTYDYFGNALCQSWQGLIDPRSQWLTYFTGTGRSGWGMYYYVGAVYYLIGQNAFAIQLINCTFGAAACVAAYKIAYMIYPRQRVARTAALLTAFSPSMILWSSQGLKDGLIVLCLCLCTLYTLKLRERMNLKDFLLLFIFLFCLYSLRHYAAYILFTAIAGSLVLSGRRFSPLRVVQGGVLVLLIGVAFAYFGAGQVAENTLDLKKIQSARVWGAAVANSGYGGDVDITDPQAAIGYLPLGTLYMLFAPFPWMVTNMRQLITLPELVVWWALVPMLLKGFWYAVRHRLKESFAICIFTLGLTLAYALYQTNVGTAYRHRAQLYVFFFIFISFGLELRREAKMKGRTQSALVQPGFAPVATVNTSGPLTGTIITPGPRSN
jgi:hypothetical protein